MENRIPNPPPETKFRNKLRRQEAGEQQLNHPGPLQKKNQHFQNFALRANGDGIGKGFSLRVSNLFARQNKEGGHCDNNAQPADLYQYQYNHLSKKRPVRGGVIYNQAGYAGSGGGSKERLQKGRIEMGSAGDRQHE